MPTLSLDTTVQDDVIAITWSTIDPSPSSGLNTCALEVQVDRGTWEPVSTDCDGTDTYDNVPGHVYTFRLSASDNVSNPASATALARFPRVTKYYYFGGQRVAMRADGVVYYLHGDHPSAGSGQAWARPAW